MLFCCPDIVGSYERYATCPSLETQNAFLDCCFEYDFSRFSNDIGFMKSIYNSFVRKNVCLEDIFMLNSNGSSGGQTKYSVGPFCGNLINRVESFQRGVPTSEIMRISTAYPDIKGMNKVVRSGYVVVDLSTPECVGFLSKALDDNPGKTHLEVPPHVFMMICCHDNLIQELSNRKISIITTGGDAYKSRKLKARDRMIDWKTGCNFYECKFGQLHILPIWFEEDGVSYNLLNLNDTDGHAVADIMKIGSFSACECGGKSCHLEFVSHFDHKPKTNYGYVKHAEITKSISGKYLNFQLIFDDRIARIMVEEFEDGSGDGKFVRDYEFLDNYLGSMGFSTKLEKNLVAYLGGRKRPIIWSGTEGLIIEQF